MGDLVLDSAHVVVASMSGDGYAVENWVPDGLPVDMLTNLLIGGHRFPEIAAPTTVVWKDGRLVDVLVGRSRALEWFAAHGLIRTRSVVSGELLDDISNAVPQ
jgi:hypothetical protein